MLCNESTNGNLCTQDCQRLEQQAVITQGSSNSVGFPEEDPPQYHPTPEQLKRKVRHRRSESHGSGNFSAKNSPHGDRKVSFGTPRSNSSPRLAKLDEVKLKATSEALKTRFADEDNDRDASSTSSSEYECRIDPPLGLTAENIDEPDLVHGDDDSDYLERLDRKLSQVIANRESLQPIPSSSSIVHRNNSDKYGPLSMSYAQRRRDEGSVVRFDDDDGRDGSCSDSDLENSVPTAGGARSRQISSSAALQSAQNQWSDDSNNDDEDDTTNPHFMLRRRRFVCT